jgi:hypothetical protein
VPRRPQVRDRYDTERVLETVCAGGLDGYALCNEVRAKLVADPAAQHGSKPDPDEIQDEKEERTAHGALAHADELMGRRNAGTEVGRAERDRWNHEDQ